MKQHHFLTALLLCTLAFSCKQEQIAPIEKPSIEDTTPSLTIDKHTLKISEGQIEKLNATLTNTEEGLSISWKSTVPSVANVNGKGEVEGLKCGTAQVIAYAGELADTCSVEVGPKPIPAKSIKLSSNGFVAKTGEQIKLTATFSPLSTTDTLHFSSSNESVATVSEDGLVSATDVGECTITASIGSLSDECAVSVISGSEASLMIVDPLDKVFEGATFLPGEDIFRVAGGEVATIQIVINAGNTSLNGIGIELDALAGTLEPEIYVQKEVLCTGNWQAYAYGRPEDELVAAANMYPDPLIPIGEMPDFAVESNSRKVLWIEYWVPNGFKDGSKDYVFDFSVLDREMESTRPTAQDGPAAAEDISQTLSRPDTSVPISNKEQNISSPSHSLEAAHGSTSIANRFIRMPLIKTRIMHWINYRYNHVGYLHWGMKYWMDGNGNNVDPFTADAVNGDSWIVYPGYEKLYPSIRLCAMRDGIRDFDLLKLVEAKDKEKAQEFVKEMVQDYDTYNTEIEHFRDLRKRMLEYLSR